jgi:hypothetical protein
METIFVGAKEDLEDRIKHKDGVLQKSDVLGVAKMTLFGDFKKRKVVQNDTEMQNVN